MNESTVHTFTDEKGARMGDPTENGNGPALGEPAPPFEANVGETRINLNDFRKSWLILFTHAGDILPLLKTRTVNYILCKRKTKVVALGQASAAEMGGFLKKYVLKHNLIVIDDIDGKIAGSYGLRTQDEGMKGVFIIDPRGTLRMKLFSPLAADQNFYEILKLRDALQEADTSKTKNRSPKTWKQRFAVTIRTKPADGRG